MGEKTKNYTAKELYHYAKEFCESYEQAKVQMTEYLDKEITVADLIQTQNIVADTIKHTEIIYENVANKMSLLEATIISDFIESLPKDLRNEITLYCFLDMLDK